LYIGGAGVARGYLNRPELTAERFIPDPFSEKSGARLYKTGDLARYLNGGELEYIGRIDHQVKVRGFRIELGEIEATLNKHPQVKESIVIAREDNPGDKKLVAYIICSDGLAPSVNELFEYLIAKLPNYMAPSAFVPMERFPLTSNGKIDRGALPAPGQSRSDLHDSYVAPRNHNERKLAAIWAQVLGVDQVGIDDNFFVIGGDSIRGIKVLSLAQESGVTFGIQQIFQYQTIRKLAQQIQLFDGNGATTKHGQPFCLISDDTRLCLPGDLDDAYPLAALQTGMLFHSETNPDFAIYHDVVGHHLKAPFDLPAMQDAIDQLISRHPILRTSFDLYNYDEPLQLAHKSVNLPLRVDDLRRLPFEEQEAELVRWVEAEKNNKFDWVQPPLLRFQIHRRSEETFQLTLSFHHILLDGWSVATLFTELFRIYFALLDGGLPALEAPPEGRFRDFISLEKQALVSDECIRFWGDKMKGGAITPLPRPSFSLPGDGTRRVLAHQALISNEVSEGIKRIAQLAEAPVKSVLLAAHLRVLSLLSGKTDVVTGLVSDGRPEGAESERALGLFLNTLPFRQRLSGETWVELIRNTFELECEMLPYRRYPLAQLQSDLGGKTLFDVTFNFVHFHVYQRLSQLEKLTFLGSGYFEETNFPLMANFGLTLSSSQIQLILIYDVTRLSADQIESIGRYYTAAFEMMTRDPESRWAQLS